MKYLICLSIISSSLFANEVIDTAQFYPYFEVKTASKTFTELHPCKFESFTREPVDDYQVQCDSSACGVYVQTGVNVYHQSLQVCNATQAHVLNENGEYRIYNQDILNANNGNYVRSFLESIDELIGYEVSVVIESFKPAQMTIGHLNDNERKLKVYNIKGKIIFNNINYDEDFILSVSDKVPAYIQVLRFRMGSENWLRLLDYKE